MLRKKSFALVWILLAAIWCVITLWLLLPRPAFAAADESFFGDGKGWFYSFRREGEQLVVSVWEPSGKRSSIRNHSADFFSFGQAEDTCYALGRREEGICLLTVQNGQEDVLLLQGTPAQGTSAAHDEEGNWYIPTQSGGKEIKIYDPDGALIDKITLPQPVQKLITLQEGPVAVTEDGLYAVPDGTCLWKGTLSEPICVNGDTLFDQHVLLRFIDGQWIPFAAPAGDWICAAADGELYGCLENKVCLLDEDGAPVKEYISDKPPERLLISGDTAAILQDQTLTLLKPSSFRPCPAQQESSSTETASPAESSKTPKESRSSTVSTPKESSRKASSRKSESTASSKKSSSRSSASIPVSDSEPSQSILSNPSEKIHYRLNDEWGLIEAIPVGTTAARFRKQLKEEGITCSFWDHHGKPATQGRLGTGWTVMLTQGGSSQTFRLVIRGDVTGEGNVNSSDTRLLRHYFEGTVGLTAAQYMAADLNEDGIIDSTDVDIKSLT